MMQAPARVADLVSFQPRPYQSTDDLRAVSALIRRAYARAPGWNAWSFARFDIWAQRRIADEVVRGCCDWQPHMALWEDEAGRLVGAVFFPDSVTPYRDLNAAVLLVDPYHRDLWPTLLDWAEAHHDDLDLPDPALRVEVLDSNGVLTELLQSRGYSRLTAHFIRRAKTLDPTVREPVTLPPGFTIQTMKTKDQVERHLHAVKTVFNFEDTLPIYRIVERARSSVPELALMVVAPNDEVAAFARLWLDTFNSVAEFEPVGTVPAYQKRGLAAALLAEGHNRLRAMGCRTATVDSWSESVGANTLYAAAGLLPVDEMYEWRAST
ncbi:MAG: GNAT family N-acetyltransferase [Anaerolineae bacterium]|nr:GNAT family N-acetyltransferase [Anaerolineae bacterium]